MRRTALSVVAIAATCAFAQDETPVFKPTTIKAPFLEQFTDDWADRWTPSEATKKTPVGGETFSYVGQWSVEEAELAAIEGDKGLVAKNKAAHHAISAPFATPIDHTLKPLVVQYEVKYQKGGNCGGGYIKLLEDGFQTSGKEFTDTTPWTIMFGPDLTCPGNKIHFIFRHKHPITGEIEEKHLKAAPKPSFEKATNLFTLVVDQDSTFKLFFNENLEKEGSLLEEFEPPVNPPKEIDDPEDKKPEDWVDEKMIDDPEATKPEDWDEDAPYEIPDEDAEKPEGWLDDEPLTIPDPDAEKPEEWDDEEDGDWIAPTISNSKCTEAPGCGEWKRPFKANPDYKGKWYAPRIDNPAYVGEWTPRQIENPTYFADITPSRSLPNIGGVGIELWTMTEDVMFDNLYIGHSLDDAQALAKETWHVKKTLEAKTDKAVEEEDEDEPVFSEDPIGYIRYRILTFVDLAKLDPVLAFKTQPQTGAALAGVVFTFIGFLGAIFGIIGSQQKPVTKSAKKTDAVTPDVKGKETAPVAPAGGKTEETSVKKRAGKS